MLTYDLLNKNNYDDDNESESKNKNDVIAVSPWWV